MSAGAAVETRPGEVVAAPRPVRPGRLFSPQRVAAGVGFLIVALLPVPFGDFGFFLGAFAAVYAMIGLSVVVVTGYAGLISLMPYTFAGIGAMTAGFAVASWGWPFWLAIPLAALATVPVALVVGMASVRLRGLYLALATLTVGNALGETLFRSETVTGGGSGWTIPRPVLGAVDFSSDVAFYILCLGVVLVLLWMSEGLRTSRLGRAMAAVRANEVEAQALGINPYKTKLVALLLGSMMAGVGGAFLGSLLVNVTGTPFRSPVTEFTSLLLVTAVAIGGIDRPLGAFVGALGLVIQTQVFGGAIFFQAFLGIYTGAVLILLLRFNPDGLVGFGRRLRELIRYRPAFGSAVTASILLGNVGLAILLVKLSS
ncbi:MAG: branched-chain amino acid ABC transporter permease [Actinomycetota bacterium]